MEEPASISEMRHAASRYMSPEHFDRGLAEHEKELFERVAQYFEDIDEMPANATEYTVARMIRNNFPTPD